MPLVPFLNLEPLYDIGERMQNINRRSSSYEAVLWRPRSIWIPTLYLPVQPALRTAIAIHNLIYIEAE